MTETKKKYLAPELKVVKLEATDIIATSGDITEVSLQTMLQEEW